MGNETVNAGVMVKESSSIEANPSRLGRQIRENIVQGMLRRFEGAEAVVLMQVTGIRTADLNRLRHEIEKLGGSFQVVKHSLSRLTFRALGWNGLDAMLKGTCGVGVLGPDVPAGCKVLVQFIKEHEGASVEGGRFGGQLIGFKDLVALSQLPPKPIMLAQVVGGMRAPFGRLTQALEGILRQWVGVMHAILKKKTEVEQRKE